MKRIISILVLLALIIPPIAYAKDNVTIFIDNVQLKEEGMIVGNSSLVPLRAIFEALGASVEWNGSTKTVISKKSNVTIELVVGRKTAKKNGKEVSLAASSQIIKGSTFVPLRFIGEAFGGTVTWDGATKSVYIVTEKETKLYKVTEVVDGDTIKVIYNGKEESVRMIGIDTPETKHPTKGVQPYGPEASAYTKERLKGKEVRLEFDVQERDMYGRLLAYVWIGNEMFNATIVKEGYAQVSTFPPNVKYVDNFVKLQAEARANKKGLWSLDPYKDLEVEQPKETNGTVEGDLSIISKDLSAEKVVIKNNGTNDINMTGWKLVSVEGNQTYDFPSGYILKAGTTVTITSGKNAVDNPPNELKWTTSYIWNNEGDSAKLLDPSGKVRFQLN
ncbi:MAG: stalk domain-containing protein [Tepidibacillus sp.]